jgi:5-methylcytosine-specific restriction protein B
MSILKRLGGELMINSDLELLKFNLKRFIEVCKKAQSQTTTKGLKLKEISGTFQGFKLHPNFGSGNLTKRPGLAFLKGNNTVSRGIYPIIVFIPESNEIIVCKGVSYDNKPPIQWAKIIEKDIPLEATQYNDEKGKFSYLRSIYQLNDLDSDYTIMKIQNDIVSIIEDYPRGN